MPALRRTPKACPATDPGNNTGGAFARRSGGRRHSAKQVEVFALGPHLRRPSGRQWSTQCDSHATEMICWFFCAGSAKKTSRFWLLRRRPVTEVVSKRDNLILQDIYGLARIILDFFLRSEEH